MDVNQVSVLLALLSFVSIMIGLAVIGLMLAGRTETLRPYLDLLVPLAFAIALVSTLGSLYYSGIAHFRPCRLCWWQRIMMYPLVPILGAALLRRDPKSALAAMPLAIGGLGISAYHTQLRWFPDQSTSCDADAACAAVWIDTFDFVSIPFLAFAGFVAITALLTVQVLLGRRLANPATVPSTQTVELQP